MKYIRMFENETEPEIGDYVICENEPVADADKNIYNILSCSIGKITDIIDTENFWHRWKYEYNVHYNKYKNGDMVFYRNEIKFFSKSKKECQIYLSAKKYNL